MKTFLLDMDGVLLDSECIFVSSLQQYLKDQGVEGDLSAEALSRFTGMKTDLISKCLQKEFHLPKTIAELSKDQDLYFDEEVKRRGRLKPMEGLEDFLQRLRAKRLKIALATSPDRVWVRYVLKQLEVTDYFDTVVTGEEAKASKPAPDIFLLAAKRTGSDPCDCVVIEDSINGIRAGKEAGMYVIGFKGSRIWQDTSSADQEVERFAEIEIDRFLKE